MNMCVRKGLCPIIIYNKIINKNFYFQHNFRDYLGRSRKSKFLPKNTQKIKNTPVK